MTYRPSFMIENGPASADLLVSVALLLIAALGIADLILDAPESLFGVHVFVEIALLGLSLGVSVILIVRIESRVAG